MDCSCGKPMNLIAHAPIKANDRVSKKLRVWACPPDGCGRIYVEEPGLEIDGTWYQAEVNKVNLFT